MLRMEREGLVSEQFPMLVAAAIAKPSMHFCPSMPQGSEMSLVGPSRSYWQCPPFRRLPVLGVNRT
jgi:hypothetical protein